MSSPMKTIPTCFTQSPRHPPEVDPSEITELNFGREWRIAGFESIPTESSASSTP